MFARCGLLGDVISVACQLDQFQAPTVLFLKDKDDNHDEDVPPDDAVQVDEVKARDHEGCPVEKRSKLYQVHPEFRFARRDPAASRHVEVSLSFVEGSQQLLLLLPAFLAPQLEVFLRDGQATDRIPTDVEVNLLGEVALEDVFLGLRNVVRVGHGYVMDGIKVVTFSETMHDEGEARSARVQDVLILLQSVLLSKVMAAGFGIFCQVCSLWEDQKLKWLLNVTKIIQHGFKMALIFFPFPADKNEGSDLHGPTEPRDGFKTGFEADFLQPEVTVS